MTSEMSGNQNCLPPDHIQGEVVCPVTQSHILAWRETERERTGGTFGHLPLLSLVIPQHPLRPKPHSLIEQLVPEHTNFNQTNPHIKRKSPSSGTVSN